MALQSNIEIMVQQGERWVIHARYPVTRKDAAIDEAKTLETTPGIGQVKVIKDVYDPKVGTSTEYIIYKSVGAKKDGAPAQDSPPPAPQKSWADDDQPSGPARPRRPAARPAPPPSRKKPRSLSSSFTRLMVVLVISLLAASAVTATLVFSINTPTFLGISVVGDSGANFFFAVFVVSFLLCASFMAASLLGGEGISAPKIITEMPKFQAQPKSKKTQPKKTEAPAPSGAPIAEEPAAPNPDEVAKQLREAAAEILLSSERKREEAAAKEQPEAEEAPAVDIQEPEPEAAGPPPLSPHAEKQKSYMLRFLGRTLETVSSTHRKLDSYTKFGLNLFLSGACEVLSQQRELDVENKVRILSDGVQALGFKADNAAAFAQNYESYLLQDARYMQMFQAGRNAMNTYFTDETEGLKHLTAAIEDWSRPKPKEEQSQVVTVMFTDMVGSTALTQTRGQQVAQQVVRAHNRIVRQALTRYNGREIKHTGDGIMASFAQASGAVDAAIQIQKDVAQHTRDYPDLPLKLKIGLNTGEPIAEDGDLFGSTVQLSARITDKASADEIFVLDSVRMVCAGRNYRFVSRGGYTLKGFDGDVMLYEVVWDENVFARKQAAGGATQP
ncbi:MAG: hypothetical protein FJX42_06735, partial [Alphaproteobacteria bacterium]|nr:hypothetical protein [Alphaproteobacteria bacterium]